MTTDLTVEEYDLAEQEAMATMANRVIEAVQPVVFNGIGYPWRIRRESELFKYVDVMHECQFESHVLNVLQGLTVNEFDLVRHLTSLVNTFGQERFGRNCLARASMLGSLNVFRHIRYLFSDARPRVFEIGPGTGYLGAMLINQGYPYAATDVSQAFYLYQNHLWNFISQGSVVELTHGHTEGEGFEAPFPGKAVHVPWWKFMGLKPNEAPQFDVVICNRTLCEMHPSSLGFALMIARGMLNGGDLPKAFVVFGWGNQEYHDAISVLECFYRSEFVMVHCDSRITVLTPAGAKSAADFLDLPAKNRLRMSRLRNYMRWILGIAPLSERSRFAPQIYSSPRNPLSRAIVSAWETEQAHRIVGIEQLNQFYTELLGDSDLTSEDEHFITMAGESGGVN